MTTDTPYTPEPTLPELLAARARGASQRRLSLDVLGGALAIAAALAWRPSWWPLPVCAGACFVAFGAWGLADRALREGGRWAGTRGVRAVAVVLGTAGAIGLALGVVAYGVGRVIS